MTCEEESALIRATLLKSLSNDWNGKICLQEMADVDAPNWKQMEWIGWYYEWRAREILIANIGGGVGPRYGNMQFDYRRDCVWDFKAHVSNSKQTWTILNDADATLQCIKDYGSIGFVIASGPADYNDETGAFKIWHDTLKGGELSPYEVERIRRGARSRLRKVAFVFNDLIIFRLDAATLQQGQTEGWIGKFQEGMRNAGGQIRRGKFKVKLSKLPRTLLLSPKEDDSERPEAPKIGRRSRKKRT